MAQARSGACGFHASAIRADDLIEVFVNGEPVQVAKGSNVMAACSAAGVDVRPPILATSHTPSIFRPRCMLRPGLLLYHICPSGHEPYIPFAPRCSHVCVHACGATA